jgi:hypothetical protein
MIEDPFVAEIRKIRHKIEEPFKGNMDKFYEFIKKLEGKSKKKLIKFKPKMREIRKTGTEG